ncbi:hypothetical protein BD410DRAFT_115415 [Rickenella mellea]|uniref:Uncharacterized protein n=1 Tax=Rickenella mellea TaxID=50990 RepID=A0A4Y7QBR7_9AGAM|nr:hypothetical protein BD410DRAFT_115415 [Rickenella mellea]
MAAPPSLTPSQQASFNQLQAITNGADREAELSILESVNWDVQQMQYLKQAGHKLMGEDQLRSLR